MQAPLASEGDGIVSGSVRLQGGVHDDVSEPQPRLERRVSARYENHDVPRVHFDADAGDPAPLGTGTRAADHVREPTPNPRGRVLEHHDVERRRGDLPGSFGMPQHRNDQRVRAEGEREADQGRRADSQGSGANNASKSPGENLTPFAGSSLKIKSASAAFFACNSRIFSSMLPATTSLYTKTGLV